MKKDNSVEDYGVTVPPTGVFTTIEVRSCADLYRLITNKQLRYRDIYFQRKSVWSRNEKTTFIDSLVKNLPIPSLCFSTDIDDGSKYPIDGLQRITTILELFDTDTSYTYSKSVDGVDIDERILGKTNTEIRNDERLWNIIADVQIPITNVRCKMSEPSHLDYIFSIFRRLNTTGKQLTNQEIRNCIFVGEFNNGLKRIAQEYKSVLGASNRYEIEEIILRGLALHDTTAEEYSNFDKGRYSNFLNYYMSKNKNNDIHDNTAVIDTIKLLDNEAIRRNIDFKSQTKSAKESILAVLFMVNENSNIIHDELKIISSLKEMLESDAFKSKSSLDSKAKVLNRISAVKIAYDKIRAN